MRVLTPKRLFLSVASLVFLTTSSFASNPSPRANARMAYDVANANAVLFGGQSAFDPGTQLSYDSNETWIWGGNRWTQRFPAHQPPPRTAHTMTYDSLRQRVVLFGGRRSPTVIKGPITFYNDTWIWKNNDWTQVDTGNAPEPRAFSSMAYDPQRDRVVLYGGSHLAADGTTVEQYYDTWEFDGTTWTKLTTTQPQVIKPLLTYDPIRKEIIMLGAKSDVSTVMYRYDGATQTWNQFTPTAPAILPPCVNESAMAFSEHAGGILLNGGLCSTTTPAADETYFWNGSTWTKLTTSGNSRTTGTAVADDPLRGQVIFFGGTTLTAAPTSATYLYRDGTYNFIVNPTRPSPRSLARMATDPANGTVWTVGGLDEFSSGYLDDLWGYRNNQWTLTTPATSPGICISPAAAFDTDRQRLVVVCSGTDIFEWDGNAWHSFGTLKPAPALRRFAGLVYDQSLKKTVMFGGYDDTNSAYRQDTWTWNGSAWAEVKNARPPHRGQMQMWYDPLRQKTVIYGGLGRPNVDTRVTRYDDMWEFNGSGWTKINTTSTPGMRFGAQLTVDPRNGKVLLFGGLVSEVLSESSSRQSFANDTWQWDGSASTWTKLEPANAPSPRENGAMAYDPVANELVLFGGYAGFYFSDVWAWDGNNWKPHTDGGRRRPSGGISGVAPVNVTP
ncbi:MAG: hypothetical protein JO197_04320 [Acidobacteria bacterium]|nr:hypothetical protein [Acidobacteriota bacterium]MBV9478560.1 hypothetical protein [Acidobacteriota bacterium]